MNLVIKWPVNTWTFSILDLWAVYLHVCIIDPHGRELREEFNKLMVGIHKDVKGYRKISDRLKISRNTVEALIRRHTLSHSTADQSRSGCPLKMTPRRVCYLALKNTRASASDLAQWLSMDIWVSVTARCTVQRTLHNVNLYGRLPRKKNLACSSARLNFGKEHEKKPDEYWKQILWSYETKIHLFGSDGVQHVRS